MRICGGERQWAWPLSGDRGTEGWIGVAKGESLGARATGPDPEAQMDDGKRRTRSRQRRAICAAAVGLAARKGAGAVAAVRGASKLGRRPGAQSGLFLAAERGHTAGRRLGVGDGVCARRCELVTG